MKFSILVSSYNQLPLLQVCKEAFDAQSFKDFEFIVADDGSSDGTVAWCGENNVLYVTQEDKGFRFTEIMRKAAERAVGDYIVFLNADSFPKEDFLERLSLYTEENRVLNGIRIHVDEKKKIIGFDWRLEKVSFDLGQDLLHIKDFPFPWELMTLTGMCVPAKVYREVGGLSPVYDEGYGRQDWSLAMKLFYSGCRLYWVSTAVVYHFKHPERNDTENNVRAFEEELLVWQKKSYGKEA